MKKTLKRTLATLLTLVMLLTSLPIIGFGTFASAEETQPALPGKKVGDIIEFGSYPQSKVTDSQTITELNKLVPDWSKWTSYGYYSGTGGWSDGQMKPSDYMRYYDIDKNSDGAYDYRAVKFTSYRPYFTGYTSDSYTSKQYFNGYKTYTVYYFKYEPLKWRILAPNDGLIMCDTAVDSQAYNNYVKYADGEYWGDSSQSNYSSNWENSSIRKWLNKDFYNTAFNSSQKSKIKLTNLENKSTYSSKYDSANTMDKVFLLSYWDVINPNYGFSSSNSTYDTARQLKSTDYAQCQGCNKNTSTSYYGNSWWSLRSPGDTCGAANVNGDGYAYDNCNVFNTDHGIAPAMRINESSLTIRYQSGKYGKCDYSDNFFENNANVYNHKLATASLAMQMSSWSMNNIKETFKELDVDYKETYNYNNPDDDFNHIACAIASKKLNNSTTLLIVNVRGGDYGVEWGGNFNLGWYGNHSGFDIASDKVLDYLNSYIWAYYDNGIIDTSNIKIWITGYSRGAATANLVSAKLIAGNHSKSILSKYSFTNNNVYCYTFETPRNTTDSSCKIEKYNSIFNIINPIDPVPYVAPESMRFERYGIDMYLPCKEIEGSRACRFFDEKVSKEMYEHFGLIYQEDFVFYEFDPIYKYSIERGLYVDYFSKENKNLGQYTFVRNLANILSEDVLGNRLSYYYAIQDAAMELAACGIGGFSKKQVCIDACNVLKDSISNMRLISISGTLNTLNNLGKASVSIAMLTKLILNSLIAHPNYIVTLSRTPSYDVIGKSYSSLFYPHSPEITMSCMLAGDETVFSNSLATTEYLINCPVDVKVYNSKNQLVASIVNDNSVNVGDIGLSYYVDENGQKRITLPKDDNYKVEMIATDTGKVNCSILEYADNGVDISKTTNYYDMAVKKGDVIVGKTTVTNSSGKVENEITGANGREVFPSEIYSDYVPEYTVTVSSDPVCEGYTIGGGKFSVGSFAEITAYTDKKHIFKGWYINDKLVSSDNNYRFRVEKDTDIIAKYDVLAASVNSVSIGDVELNYKKSTTLKPTIDADSGIKYTVTYESSNPKVATVDENGKVYGAKKGNATITCTVTDQYGNAVKDTANVKVKYNFGQWLIVIVLFGWIWY